MKNPLPQSLDRECTKCAKIIRSFTKVNVGVPGKGMITDQFIPTDIISNAKGIAILTVVKAGFMWAGKAGSGLVVARLPNGSWSAPSAIATAGVSFGGQIGAEVTDFVIILNTDSAVKAFSQSGNVTLGGSLSVAAGPWGRTGEVVGTARNTAAVYSYSKSKGLFAGVSIEGSVIVERSEANDRFYNGHVTAKQLLSGQVPSPHSANDLHAALNEAATVSTVIHQGTHISGSPYDSSSGNYNNALPPGSLSSRPIPPPPLTPRPHITKSDIMGTTATPITTIDSATASHVNPTPPPYTNPIIQPSSRGHHPPSVSSSLDHKNMSHGSFSPIPASSSSSESLTAVALYDFEAQQNGDLSFRRGDIITILQRGNNPNPNQWWLGRCHGREGSFPANYVELTTVARHV